MLTVFGGLLDNLSPSIYTYVILLQHLKLNGCVPLC